MGQGSAAVACPSKKSADLSSAQSLDQTPVVDRLAVANPTRGAVRVPSCLRRRPAWAAKLQRWVATLLLLLRPWSARRLWCRCSG